MRKSVHETQIGITNIAHRVCSFLSSVVPIIPLLGITLTNPCLDRDKPAFTLEPAFRAPSTRDKQWNKGRGNEEPVFRIGNAEVALRVQHHVVIAAEIDDGPAGCLTPSEIPYLERFKPQPVVW